MYYNYAYNFSYKKTYIRAKLPNRLFKRFITRSAKSKKFQKLQGKVKEFQKFSMICFIGNPKTYVLDKKLIDAFFTTFGNLVSQSCTTVADFFRAFVNLATHCFNVFVDWVGKFFPAVTGIAISFFKKNPHYIIFGVAISMLLMYFRSQVAKTSAKILNWFISIFEKYQIGCLTILLLTIYGFLMIVTDLPRLPIRAIIASIIKLIMNIYKTISSWLNNPSKLSTEVGPESNFNGERNSMIILFVLAVMIMKYALIAFESEVFETLPFGDVLVEVYKYDTTKPKSRIGS